MYFTQTKMMTEARGSSKNIMDCIDGNLLATKWEIYSQNGIHLKPEDDDMILDVQKCTNSYYWGVVTFSQPVDRKTAQDILRERYCVCVFVFDYEENVE